MPPNSYGLLHSEARLTDQEVDALVAGLQATFGSEDHEGESDDDDD
jgi:hypothetical protein